MAVCRRDGAARVDGRHVMSVALSADGDEFTFGKSKALFADEYDFGPNISIANYDVTRDGRFIMLRRGPHGAVCALSSTGRKS